MLERWQVLQTEAIEKDYRVDQGRQQWSQFRADLQSLSDWLEGAEAMQALQSSVPSSISQLSTEVVRQKEMAHQLNTRRPVVLSINLFSRDLALTHETEGLREQLDSVNRRWDRAWAMADVWAKELQIALLQSADYHEVYRI